MHRTLRSSLPLIALTSCLVLCTAHAEGDAPPPLALEFVELEPVLASQRTDLEWFRPVGEELVIGAHVFAVKRRKDELLVAAAPGKVPSIRVKEASTVRLAVGRGKARREVPVHLRPDAEGGWLAAVIEGRRVTIGDWSVDLVDLDGDGAITPGGGDGFRAPGGALTLPLGETLSVGADRIAIERIEDDRLFGAVSALATVEDRRSALARINDLRLRLGLPPVELDDELSAACTAHAEYLRVNRWSGYTNPHSESEERPGYTEAGARAARSSVIMGEPHRFAIEAYFRTVYHRTGFSDPFLERVGISTGPRRISVIDVQSGSPPQEQPAPEWRDPILVPADGAVDFPTRFCSRGEVPAPTSRPARRGNPLTLVFARWDHGVIDLHAELVRIDGDDEIPVPTIVAEPQQGSRLLGVVPEEPLESGATFRVTYRLGRYEEPEQVVTATFRTR